MIDGIKPVRGTLKDIEVVVYHRTFSKMIEHILASGFVIERVVEPQPLKSNSEHYEQLTRIPTFMIWVLRK